jgi:hypothetical protein
MFGASRRSQASASSCGEAPISTEIPRRPWLSCRGTSLCVDAPLEPDLPPVLEIPARTASEHVGAQALKALQRNRVLHLPHLAADFGNDPIYTLADAELLTTVLQHRNGDPQSAVHGPFVERRSDLGLGLDPHAFAGLETEGQRRRLTTRSPQPDDSIADSFASPDQLHMSPPQADDLPHRAVTHPDLPHRHPHPSWDHPKLPTRGHRLRSCRQFRRLAVIVLRVAPDLEPAQKGSDLLVFDGERRMIGDHGTEPRLLPEDHASSPAPVVRLPAAPELVEEHHVVVREPPRPPMSFHTGLFHPSGNAEALPATADHLRHEWNAVERTVGVERGQDLEGGPDDDLLPGAQPTTSPSPWSWPGGEHRKGDPSARVGAVRGLEEEIAVHSAPPYKGCCIRGRPRRSRCAGRPTIRSYRITC